VQPTIGVSVWLPSSKGLQKRTLRNSTEIFPQRSGKWEMAFFAAFDDDGVPTVVFVNIVGPHATADGTHFQYKAEQSPIGPQLHNIGMGHTAVFLEFRDQSSERAKRAFKSWRSETLNMPQDELDIAYIVQLVKWVTEYDDKRFVGGEVDVIKIGKAGVRWIHRKKACPDH
jgi:hypothetical protein